MSKVTGSWNSAWTGGASSYANLTINEDGTGTWSGPTSSGILEGKLLANGSAFAGRFTFNPSSSEGASGPSGQCAFVAQGDALVGVWGDGNLWNGTRMP